MAKANSILTFLLKALLLILLLYILSTQLNLKNITIDQFKSIFLSITLSSYLYGFAALLLMPFNWFLESFKWKKLVHIVQDSFTVLVALKAVLIGVFFGFITPNRIGEFGGRLFKINKGNKAKALNLSLVGGLAQFVVTFLVGITAAVYFFADKFDFKNLLFTILPIIYFFSLLIYFNFNWFVLKLFKIKKLEKLTRKYIFDFELSKKFLLELLAITFLRYTVYLLQYVFVLQFLGIELNTFLLVQAVSTMLLIQTIVPSFALLDLGIRGNVLLFLLSEYTDKQLVILFSVLLVWILNLVIPAIIGYISLINLKLEVKNEKVSNRILIDNRE